MPTNVSFHGTAAEIADEVTDFLGREVVARVTTDVILAELRHRMLEQGCSVNIVPMAAKPNGDETPANPATPKPSRKPRQTPQPETPADVPASDEKVEATAPVEPPSEQNSTPEKEIEQPATAPVEPGPLDAAAAASASTAQEATSAPTPTAPSRDEVIAALNAFATARGGQVAGRTKMQEVCGVTRLVDVKPEQFGKLLDALKAAA